MSESVKIMTLIRGRSKRPGYKRGSGRSRNKSVEFLFPRLKPLRSLCLLTEMHHLSPNNRRFHSNQNKGVLGVREKCP